jgi:Na+/melibiose symporter-like transporter
LFGYGDGWALVIILVIRGSSFASILFLANSMAADVVDFDTLASGRQRTGLFFAVWAMTSKLSVAIGVLLATVIPALFGIEPADPSTFTPHTEFALMAVYGWLPGVIMALGAVSLWNFPITRERQLELRAQIAAARE